MMKDSNNFIRPLGEAANEFIQVLLSEFLLTRKGSGTTCEVKFNDKTPCIWTREGKRHVRERIRGFEKKAAAYGRQLDDFFALSKGRLSFHDDRFPFRFVSGGTLPVIRLGDAEYFALIYRETFPVGWNLANGGADTPAELLNPFAVAERELREELLVLNRRRGFRYVFDTESENPVDMPEYLIARQLWKSQLAKKGWGDISRFEPLPMPVKWLDGPDTLKIRYDGRGSREQKDCYLNIRAEDFGIEVDRIAKLNLDADAVLLDGELVNGRLVGAPVGLFETRRMADLLAQGAREFLPDIFFYDGKRFEGKDADFLSVLVKKFLPHICKVLPTWNRGEWDTCVQPFDLCPVTRGVLERAAKLWTATKAKSGDYDVFISFAEPDKELATEVYGHVCRRMGLKTYFSKVSVAADYSEELDNALDSANCLIAVGSDPGHFSRKWPNYEIRSFHKDLMNEVKPESAKIVPFLSNVNPNHCPKPLSFYNAVIKEAEGKKALTRLGAFVAQAMS